MKLLQNNKIQIGNGKYEKYLWYLDINRSIYITQLLSVQCSSLSKTDFMIKEYKNPSKRKFYLS